VSVNPSSGAGRSYASAVLSLLDRRLVVVTGKGGAGKTTVAAALALARTRAGGRAIVCEVGGGESVSRAFGRRPAGHVETELSPGLWAISLEPRAALAEYLRDRLGSSTVSGLLFENRLFQSLADATPGLREMVTMGKVWELAQPERRSDGASAYDLVVLDAPATGHALGLLGAPSTFRDVASAGPVHRQAEIIGGLISDPSRTAVVAAALPEETPVNETLELSAQLRDELGVELRQVVVSGLIPERFERSEVARIEASLSADGASPATDALRQALADHGRALEQGRQVERLREALGDDAVLTLPRLADGALDRSTLERLSQALERAR